ncbi:MAG: two pore domain potassium channel family protein, partial [Terriglobales bacterium]
MHILALVAVIAIMVVVLLDAFETVVLPRRVQRHFRITILFYRNTWAPYAKLASRIKSQTRRETVLGYFGPLSMIALLGIWALSLIFAFALL